MNEQARLISSDLELVDEAELARVVQLGIESIGRHSAHPADRIAAAQVAAGVMRAIRRANYVVLQGPPATLRASDDMRAG
jgi:hypothetical protein